VLGGFCLGDGFLVQVWLTAWRYSEKKVTDFPVKSRDAIIKLFPARESLVSDIPAWDGKIANLSYSVCGSVKKMWISVMGKGWL
jgi:hypothetical protein